jgi:hypothetical protein
VDHEFAHATEDLDIPGRLVEKGTVAGVIAKWLGIAGAHPVIELNVQWTLSDDIQPAWDIAMAYLIEVNGTPQLKLRAEVLPTDMSLPLEEPRCDGVHHNGESGRQRDCECRGSTAWYCHLRGPATRHVGATSEGASRDVLPAASR